MCYTLTLVTSVKSQSKIWASAICLQANGACPNFVNAKLVAEGNGIGTTNLTGNMGVFGASSGSFKLKGAIVYTSVGTGEKICEVQLKYTVYPAGNRPIVPVFNHLVLPLSCRCDGANFRNFGNASSKSINE